MEIRRLSDQSGQSTVEFAVTFPVLMVVAVIAINGLLFLGDCAAFDRCARQAVRVVAVSPAYGQTVDMSSVQIAQMIKEEFDADYQEVSVSASGEEGGCVVFTATIDFAPTLFGRGMKDQVFGVALPHLSHSVALAVEIYKPGVILS